MKNIVDIYNKYKIVINLQENQRRVAAISKIVADHILVPLDKKGVVIASLLHDMGNILKFDLSVFKDYSELDDQSYAEMMRKHWVGIFGDNKESADIFVNTLLENGRDYWHKVKAEYASRYGTNEHAATIAIAQELQVPENIIDYLRNIGFSNLDKVYESQSLEEKICAYADMRVAIYGVASIDQRLEDARKRYKNMDHSIVSNKYEELADALRKIEKQIQEKTSIDLSSIDDAMVNPIMQELSNFDLES